MALRATGSRLDTRRCEESAEEDESVFAIAGHVRLRNFLAYLSRWMEVRTGFWRVLLRYAKLFTGQILLYRGQFFYSAPIRLASLCHPRGRGVISIREVIYNSVNKFL